MKGKSESEVAQSCPTLCNPMDCSPPGSSVHGIFQARVLEWGAIVFSYLVHTSPQINNLFFRRQSRTVREFGSVTKSDTLEECIPNIKYPEPQGVDYFWIFVPILNFLFTYKG